MPATPKQAAQDVLDRSRALLTLDQAHTPAEVRADIRRMSLAMGVAAIDTYLHWAVRGSDLDVLSAKLAKLDISFSDLLEMGDTSVYARRNDIQDRPRVRARNVLNRQLLTMTFQTPRQVEDALSMAGVTKVWSKLETAFVPKSTSKEIKDRLNGIVHHRNQIVHEGGLRRLVRPQAVTRQEIGRANVNDDLDWIQSFVDALAVVCP
mgnify:FL=1